MIGVPQHLQGILKIGETQRLFADEAMIGFYLDVERAYLRAQGETDESWAQFSPDYSDLQHGTARDGVVIPALVAQMRQTLNHPKLHKGMTSQDVIDTGRALALQSINDLLINALHSICTLLDDLSNQFGGTEMMGRTRMQAALPITVADRISIWKQPLADTLSTFRDQRKEIEVISLSSAVGTAAPWPDAPKIRADFARELGLNTAPNWHSNRSRVTQYGGLLAQITGSLGKMGQDLCLMSQQGIDEVAFTGGGTSSIMAHKNNPVGAEILVSLARFNATLISGLHHSSIHEQERSGSAWTLEWLILPQMLAATEASLNLAEKTLRQISRIGAS